MAVALAALYILFHGTGVPQMSNTSNTTGSGDLYVGSLDPLNASEDIGSLDPTSYDGTAAGIGLDPFRARGELDISREIDGHDTPEDHCPATSIVVDFARRFLQPQHTFRRREELLASPESHTVTLNLIEQIRGLSQRLVLHSMQYIPAFPGIRMIDMILPFATESWYVTDDVRLSYHQSPSMPADEASRDIQMTRNFTNRIEAITDDDVNLHGRQFQGDQHDVDQPPRDANVESALPSADVMNIATDVYLPDHERFSGARVGPRSQPRLPKDSVCRILTVRDVQNNVSFRRPNSLHLHDPQTTRDIKVDFPDNGRVTIAIPDEARTLRKWIIYYSRMDREIRYNQAKFYPARSEEHVPDLDTTQPSDASSSRPTSTLPIFGTIYADDKDMLTQLGLDEHYNIIQEDQRRYETPRSTGFSNLHVLISRR